MIDCETRLHRVDGAAWARAEPPMPPRRRVDVKGWIVLMPRKNATQLNHMVTQFRLFPDKADVKVANLDDRYIP